jgi:hypothetical protein
MMEMIFDKERMDCQGVGTIARIHTVGSKEVANFENESS